MTKNNADKLARLYSLYEQPMYRIAFAVLRNETAAEDAVSDGFMRIIRKIGIIGEPDSPETKAYIVKTIKSAAIDAYRKNRRFYEKNQPIDESILTVADTSVDIEGDIFESTEEDLLDELNDTDREIILLRCRDEMTWDEVADKTGMTASNARKRFERARKKLIKPKGADDYGKQTSK